ncbi:WXG100 family type VII secretion target [Anaerosporobacter sp.]
MSKTTGAGIGGGIIKVTPETLYQKAEAVQDKISTMQTKFNNMLDVVSKCNSYWIGNAGDAHRKIYKEYEPEITEIFKRLSEHVTDLNAMAGVYSDAEKTVKEVAENLPTNLIS